MSSTLCPYVPYFRIGFCVSAAFTNCGVSEPSGAVCDLLWSKFDPDITGWSGCGLVSEFGFDFLDEFLTKNNLEMIICSDRLTQDDHKSFHGDKLVSIHSTCN